MSYIDKNTTVKILRNVTITNDYNNTIYFANQTNQYNYFNSKVAYTQTGLSYCRINKGVIRVNLDADAIYDCNYLMFQNGSHNNKWFYCFINKIEYVGENVADVFIELDVMQTWFLNCTLQQCYVERQHVTNDTIGANLVSDNIEIGQYVYDQIGRTTMTEIPDKYSIVVAVTETSGGTNAFGFNYSHVYSGLMYYVFSPSDIVGLNDFLDSYATEGRLESIICIFQIPDLFLPNIISGNSIDTSVPTKRVNVDITRDNALRGYIPKNNKLFTYPYSYLQINNLQGNTAIYQFEYSNNINTISFDLGGNISPNCSAFMLPKNYKSADYAYEDMITMGDAPTCAWSNDYYTAWRAQNQVSVISKMATASILTGASVATGNVVGAVIGASTVMGAVGDMYKANKTSNQLYGNVNSGSLQYSLLNWDFQYYVVCPKLDVIKNIDDYWYMFGYPIKRLQTPNVHARANWTYVQTIGCGITGSAPADAIKKICELFDRGITFWTNGDNVGNYSLSNNII